MTERLLSVDDVATFLGVKRDTVYKLIDRNGLPGVKVGRLWKFRQQQLDAWIDRQPGRTPAPAIETNRRPGAGGHRG
ncbi:MAG: helix-turn-helix domain-containing protein [Planctomycetia bacterium]|nr:MAG: helix-turn-helix domain-containing protein [Planctomycetia bacterium]